MYVDEFGSNIRYFQIVTADVRLMSFLISRTLAHPQKTVKIQDDQVIEFSYWLLK